MQDLKIMSKPAAIHIVLVLLLLAVPVVSSPDFDGTLSLFRVAPFQREFLRFALVTAFFYLNLFFLLPHFFSEKKPLYFLLVGFCFALIVALPPLAIPALPMQLPQHDLPNDSPKIHNENSFLRNIFAALLPFLFGLLSSLFIYRNRMQRGLEEQKTRAELDGLKYRLQPHFLFNVLNSIYALTITKSEDAPNAVLKLSSIMRYIVSESNADFVLLKREIAYIRDFVALQLLRTDENLKFSYSEDGEADGLLIAPMILINFIENAFKYGYSTENESEIEILVKILSEDLHLNVRNKKINTEQQDTFKIGLQNSLQRLTMIYPKSHSVEIIDNEETFSVDLKIFNLKKNEN